MFRRYVEQLSQGKPLSSSSEECLRLCICSSEGFDLLDCDGRKEAVRALMGLLRFLSSEISDTVECLMVIDWWVHYQSSNCVCLSLSISMTSVAYVSENQRLSRPKHHQETSQSESKDTA